jgi:AcrR family transcriptional regulator
MMMNDNLKAYGAHVSSVETGQRKPKGRGHERRDEILGAAARLFVEHGFESVSTRRIADALGISQTTLYVYFPTKDAILEALCERCFTHLVQVFDTVVQGVGDPIDKLRRLMRAYVDFGLKHSDEYRITFMLSHSHPKDKYKNLSLRPELQPQGIQCFLKMQDQVALLGQLGDLKHEPEVVAQCLWAAGHGLVALLITLPDFPWIDREELIEKVIEIQFEGLLQSSAVAKA